MLILVLALFSKNLETFLSKINNAKMKKNQKIAVIGLGYVGLPLTMGICKKIQCYWI